MVERLQWAAMLIKVRYGQIMPLVAKCGCEWPCAVEIWVRWAEAI
jgi:hypothetical protein